MFRLHWMKMVRNWMTPSRENGMKPDKMRVLFFFLRLNGDMIVISDMNLPIGDFVVTYTLISIMSSICNFVSGTKTIWIISWKANRFFELKSKSIFRFEKQINLSFWKTNQTLKMKWKIIFFIFWNLKKMFLFSTISC